MEKNVTKEYLKKHKFISLSDYLKKINSDTLFFFENNRVEVSLGNLQYSVPRETDSRPVLFRS